MLKKSVSEIPDQKFTLHFPFSEWTEIFDALQLKTQENYRDVVRLGRKTRLPENKRLQLWRIFEKTRNELFAAGLITSAEMFTRK